MTTIINWLKHWLGPVKPAETDTNCPHCHGNGYDSSGYTCTCQPPAKVAKVGSEIHGREALHGLPWRRQIVDLARAALLVIAVLSVSLLTVKVMR